MQNKYLSAAQKPSFQPIQQQPTFNQNAALQSHLTKYNTVLAKTQAKKDVKAVKVVKIKGLEQAKHDQQIKQFEKNIPKAVAGAVVFTGFLIKSVIV